MERRRLDDRETVRGAIQVHGKAWRAAYDGLLPESVLERVTVAPGPKTIDNWRERLPDKDDLGAAQAITIQGQVRGYVYVRWGDTKEFVGPTEAGLKELYVHPDWWGAGLGTSLLSSAVTAVPDGTTGLALDALKGNDIGRSFYESRGFTSDGTSQIEIDDEIYETVVYRRPIGDLGGGDADSGDVDSRNTDGGTADRL